MNYPIILRRYRYSMLVDKFKAFVIVIAAWAIFLLVVYTPWAILIMWGAASYWSWGAYGFIYMAVFLMGGFMAMGYMLSILRGMYDWIEDWYIKRSAERVPLSTKLVRIHGLGHWLAILGHGFSGNGDRIQVFDGFEGRRYYYDNRANRNWRYDDYNPRWQYPH